MSRVAKQPVEIPSAANLNLNGNLLTAKGPKGELSLDIHELVSIDIADNSLSVKAKDSSKQSKALSGTFRALAANLVQGVTQGFEKKLKLIGVGYRAQLQGNTLNLTLGLSHPVNYDVPAGIQITVPAPTEIVVTGNCKQKVGQVAADIRKYRPPEPYKGKGIRYADEQISLKEAKKK